MNDEAFLNRVNGERISDRQIDELIGISRGLCADGVLNQSEIEFLQKWLAANATISGHPVIKLLYRRLDEILKDGTVDDDERTDLFTALNGIADNNFELGEVLKPSSLPLCSPAPLLTFADTSYCFTGTFSFGKRKDCERAVIERGGVHGSLTRNTHVLVIGNYATESWLHSSFGAKIIKASEMRAAGVPIKIVSEQHWIGHL